MPSQQSARKKAVGKLIVKAGPALCWILTFSKVVQAEQHAKQRPEQLLSSSTASVQSGTLGTPIEPYIQQLSDETATTVRPMYHHSPGQCSVATVKHSLRLGQHRCGYYVAPLGGARASLARAVC